MSKQSSIDWLWDKIDNCIPFQGLKESQIFNGLLEQAKAMHKEEHGLTWDKSIENFEARGRNEVRAIVDFDEYYNQTFEK